MRLETLKCVFEACISEFYSVLVQDWFGRCTVPAGKAFGQVIKQQTTPHIYIGHPGYLPKTNGMAQQSMAQPGLKPTPYKFDQCPIPLSHPISPEVTHPSTPIVDWLQTSLQVSVRYARHSPSGPIFKASVDQSAADIQWCGQQLPWTQFITSHT